MQAEATCFCRAPTLPIFGLYTKALTKCRFSVKKASGRVELRCFVEVRTEDLCLSTAWTSQNLSLGVVTRLFGVTWLLQDVTNTRLRRLADGIFCNGGASENEGCLPSSGIHLTITSKLSPE